MRRYSTLVNLVLALALFLSVSGWAAAQAMGTPQPSVNPALRSTSEFRISIDTGSDTFQGFDWTSPSLPAAGQSMGQGYTIGAWMILRPFKYFDFFLHFGYHPTSFLAGQAGEWLTGAFFDPYGPYQLPEKVYYRSYNFPFRAGLRFIYPIQRFLEPWIGVGLGMNLWGVALTGEDKSNVYGATTWGVTTPTLSFLAGVDYVFRGPDGKRIGTIGLFLDGGRSLNKVDMDWFIWDGVPWSTTNAPGIPAWKFGISLGTSM